MYLLAKSRGISKVKKKKKKAFNFFPSLSAMVDMLREHKVAMLLVHSTCVSHSVSAFVGQQQQLMTFFFLNAVNV